MTPAGGFALSEDGTKIMTSSFGGFSILDASPAGERSKKSVSVNGLIAEIDPVAEWNQIFNEVQQRYRDWFYAGNMHGFDWVRIREDYKKWLPYVAHRSDLNYIISEMCRSHRTARVYRRRRFQFAVKGARGPARSAI